MEVQGMTERKQVNLLFAGCGFLASHLLLHLLPHTDTAILLDREDIEQVNYDNSIFPKHYSGHRKVNALASLVTLLSSVKAVPVHRNITNSTQLSVIHEHHSFDCMIVTFDNLRARQIAHEFSILAEIPALFIGVTAHYIYIDWSSHIVFPQTPEEIDAMEREIATVRDVCTRLEFRPLGAIAAGYAYHCFVRWLLHGEQHMYQVHVREAIRAGHIQRTGGIP
jgi:hypothetical protein